MSKSYGDAPKSRVWELLEAILQYIDEDIRQLTTPDRQIGAVIRCLAEPCLLVLDNLESMDCGTGEGTSVDFGFAVGVCRDAGVFAPTSGVGGG